jgi:ribosome maturation protein Sdo1
MADEETRQKREEESESEEEEEDVVETIPKIEIDPSKLTPLSPEVISKQVSTARLYVRFFVSDTVAQQATINLGKTDLQFQLVMLNLISNLQVLLGMLRTESRRW